MKDVVHEQERRNPTTGFKETVWSHDRFVEGWRFTGRKHENKEKTWTTQE